MKKLTKFQDWLTVKDTSRFLSEALGEKIRTRDIYRLAIENKIILSLFFVNNTLIEIATTDNNNALVFNNNFQQIRANTYCDLVNCDNSTLILKQHYYNNSAITLKLDHAINKGIIICLPDGLTYGRIATYSENNNQLIQSTVTPCLPNDIYLVVRKQYLFDFINRANNADQNNQLHTKEKMTLYKLLAVLISMNKLSTDKEYKTANIIKNHSENLGIDSPARDTIAKHLKEASYYLMN